jgi:hypothetical protein
VNCDQPISWEASFSKLLFEEHMSRHFAQSHNQTSFWEFCHKSGDCEHGEGETSCYRRGSVRGDRIISKRAFCCKTQIPNICVLLFVLKTKNRPRLWGSAQNARRSKRVKTHKKIFGFYFHLRYFSRSSKLISNNETGFGS